ncbi:MAG: Catabolite control protein A [bacterium]|nr:LacI family DNA-binding transcriptional regulator [bacterium]MBV6483063.1 Catabolite control protein A [bacterium]
MAVTIRDLARMSNTSVATVSRALGKKPGVTPETRERILHLAESLGYQPNRTAQSLVRKKTHLIGLVVSAISNPWYVEFLGRMEIFCNRRGYQILVSDSALNVEREKENINIMLQHQAEGLIIFPVSDWLIQEEFDYYLKLKLKHFPFVLIGKVEGYGFDCVFSEEVSSARTLARHLIGLGHRHFGVVGYDPNNRPCRERLQGIRLEMESAGLCPSMEEGLRITGCDRSSWVETLGGWFTSSIPPTALIPTNCQVSLELYRPLQQMGISIPGDVSIASFDDTFWVKLVTPSLSVCRPDDEMVSQLALQTLMERIENPNGISRIQPVPQQLVVRESSGPAPQYSDKKEDTGNPMACPGSVVFHS